MFTINEYVVQGAENFELYALLQIKSALKLEVAGMKHSRGSAYAKVKKDFGFKGNKQSVLKQLIAHINNKYNTDIVK
jgi:hypothetical protein